MRQGLADLAALGSRPEWRALRAVQSGRVWLLDGERYLNRPGPGLYRAAELVAAALHSDRAGVFPADDEMVQLSPARIEGRGEATHGRGPGPCRPEQR